jgi:nucleoside-diphosphate-sugar epimerase
MTHIANAVAKNRPLSLLNDHALVDLVHVEDAAAAFIQADSLLEGSSLPKGALSRYSITSGYDVSAVELVSLFERIGGQRISIDRGSQRLSSRKVKPWRGVTLPGWEPRIALEEGIRRILQNRKLGQCE